MNPFRMALCAAILSGPAAAQVEEALISGTVTDASGAPVSAAKITISHVETNTWYSTRTDGRGFYRSVPLPIGHYAIAAEHPGFKRAVRTGIRLAIQQHASVDLTLEVGTLSEQVLVTSDVPLLQSTEASRGEVIDHQKIVDLPLNGRDYLELGLLTAGTNVPPPGSRFGGFSAAGLRVSHNSYLLDGMDNNSNQQAAQGGRPQVIAPSVDAIQEFKVQTSNYSAEFGRNVGVVVNVTIKSGTNDFHGGLFDFLRNEKLDARNFFDSPDDRTPPYKRNQFGGLVGGPVRKNKTFFFVDYQGERVRTSGTVLSTIPTALERAGDFSQSIFNNQPVRIFDPASYDPASGARLPFAGNVVPQDRIDPVARKLAAFYPQPNRANPLSNYLRNPLSVDNAAQWDMRLDHNLGRQDTLYGRFSFQNSRSWGAGTLPPPAFGGGDDTTIGQNRPRSLAVSYQHIFSPAIFNTLRAGYNRLLTLRRAPISEDLNQQIGLRGAASLPGLANFGINGFRGLGTQAGTPEHADSQTRQITDDLIWVRGRHTWKTGINFSYIQAPHQQPYQAHGVFTFNGNFTRQSQDQSFGDPWADFLLGIPATSQISTMANGAQRRRLYHAYVQDQFRLSSRLTLDFGVRYEYTGPWFEKYNHYANFDIDSDRAHPRILLARPGGIAERSTLTPDYNNFGPRLGVAYALDARTVVRTGYGVYFGGVDNLGDRYLHAAPPFFFESTFSTDSLAPAILLRDGFPPGATRADISNLQTISQDRRNLSPYAQQWNFTIQRAIARDLSLEIGYVGTKGSRLLQRFDTNEPPPGPGDINQRRPVTRLEVPGLDYIVTPLADTFRREFSANSIYHSLQVKAEKRLSWGLSLLGSYIWSKDISDARGGADAGGTAPVGVQDVHNLRAERSLADEHFPHRFVLSYNYDLPFGRGHRFRGGWSIGGITTVNSGRRVNVDVQGDPANTGNPNRPNATGVSPYLPAERRSLNRWFNTDAFVRNAPYTFGNVSRNAVQAPGAVNFDFAVYKLFRVSDYARLQFRAELFNATNTPHFGAPGATMGTNLFGVISSAGPARIVQAGAKLNF